MEVGENELGHTESEMVYTRCYSLPVLSRLEPRPTQVQRKGTPKATKMQQVLHQSPRIQGITCRTKRVTLRARRRQGCREVPFEREIREHFARDCRPAENRHECEALDRRTVFVETGEAGTFTTCERVTRRCRAIGSHKVALDYRSRVIGTVCDSAPIESVETKSFRGGGREQIR